MAFDMIHCNQRLLKREGQRLGIGDAYQKRASQAGSLRDGDSIDSVQLPPRLAQSPANHRNNGS